MAGDLVYSYDNMLALIGRRRNTRRSVSPSAVKRT